MYPLDKFEINTYKFFQAAVKTKEEKRMFCGNCGIENENSAIFCKNCGARLQAQQTAFDNPVPVAKKTFHLSRRNIGIFAAASALVALILVVVLVTNVFFGGRSASSTAKKLLNIMSEGNISDMIDLFPEKVINYGLEENDMTRKEMNEYMEDLEKQYMDSLEYFGSSVKISGRILSYESLSSSELRELREEYEDEDIKIKISSAKDVDIELTLSALGMKQSRDMTLRLIKVGRSWYLDIFSFDFSDLF